MNAEAEFVRQAIQRQEYRKALVQWNDYAKHLRRAVEAGRLPEDQMIEARGLVEWSRPVLLGARAQLQAQIHELEVAATYARRPAHPAGRLEVRL